jgi:hypothetical protein
MTQFDTIKQDYNFIQDKQKVEEAINLIHKYGIDKDIKTPEDLVNKIVKDSSGLVDTVDKLVGFIKLTVELRNILEVYE